jgi:hypothetical protein
LFTLDLFTLADLGTLSSSDTFARIRPADVPGFISAQIVGALAGTFLSARWFPFEPAKPEIVEPITNFSQA